MTQVRPIARLALFGVAALGLLSAAAPAAPKKGKAGNVAGPGRIELRHVDSWGYQLQNVRPRLVTKDGLDLLVVDYSRDGADAGALTSSDVAVLRKRTREPDRIILAYLSVGEAEDYRYYWDPAWSVKPDAEGNGRVIRGPAGPSDGVSVGVRDKGVAAARLTAAAPTWLADENPEWRGNYLVRYWAPEWQAIMFGSPSAYLDKIISAGFDGVYLDKIDSNDDWQKSRPSAERDMVDFIKRLAAYARQKRPGFLIVPQNGEELLQHADYVQTIDAIAKEDLLYGGGTRKDGEPNPEAEIAKSKKLLDKARRAQRLVLTVEYLDEIEAILAARKRMRSYDYVPFFARRALGETPVFPPRSSAVNGESGRGTAHD